MPKMSAELRDEQLELANFLIAEGRVTNWKQLGTALGISRQAAQARFGPDGYGLQMPKLEVEKMDDRVYLSLPPSLKRRIDAAAGPQKTTEYLREFLDAHLPA